MNDKINHQDRDGDLAPKEIAPDQLKDTRLVRPPGLPNAGIFEALLPHARYQTYLARKAILREGETPTAIYFVLRGSVSVMMQDEDGHELILAYLGPGEFFGELGLFGSAAKRSAQVTTRTHTEVAVISYTRFLELCRNNIDLLMQLTEQIATRLRATSQRMGHLAFLDVTGRIARVLLELAHDSQATTHTDGMLIRITREELGRIANCTREMAGRVLHGLEAQGLIEVQGKSIVVHGTR
jgi:CRP/FNR family transcriptional regulator, cyclic AMP receptor protein